MMPGTHQRTAILTRLALAVLATCTLSGLAWVSTTALQAEARERATTQRAEAANREYLALWRLDSSLLGALGLENNRPASNYTPLGEPGPVLLDRTGVPTHQTGYVPTPLFDAALPPWMLLHVELEAASGWQSPQVPPDALLAMLTRPPLALNLGNCTLARRELLYVLRAQYGVRGTLAELQRQSEVNPADTQVSLNAVTPDGPMPPGNVEKVRDTLKAQQTAQEPMFNNTNNSEVIANGLSESQARKRAFDQTMTPRGNFENLNHNTRNSAMLPGVGLQAPAVDRNPADRPLPILVPPQPVALTALRARWLTGADGKQRLLLLREATTPGRSAYQGVLVDWPALQRSLLEQVQELLPGAAVEPVGLETVDSGELQMTTLPLMLHPNMTPPPEDTTWTPLRIGLVLAWVAALLALFATVWGARAILQMAERRMRFASAVSHELRTPLTAMQLHLDLLTGGLITDDAKRTEYLHTLSDATDRLHRLVENVLDFSRLEKSSASQNAAAVGLWPMLQQMHRRWAPRLAVDGYELKLDVLGDEAVAVRIDERVLEQLLGNLIENARKYARTAAPGTITLHLDASPLDAVQREVRDDGPGVPERERQAIFRPFIRGSGTTESGGAGLGLALARQWAELYGGTLTYHSGEPGATFRLTLPRRL